MYVIQIQVHTYIQVIIMNTIPYNHYQLIYGDRNQTSTVTAYVLVLNSHNTLFQKHKTLLIVIIIIQILYTTLI